MGVYVARLGDECIRCHKDKLIFVKDSGTLYSVSDAHLECPSCKAGFILFYLTDEERQQLGNIAKPNDSVYYIGGVSS